MIKILLLYFVPIIIMFILCYLNMEKGQTFEEYINYEYDGYTEFLITTFVPVFNIISVLYMILIFIYNKIKYLKK